MSFIPIKQFAGDLIISQRRYELRSTLTTKELIFQKPHITYYIWIDLILGIVPYQPATNKKILLDNNPIYSHKKLFKISCQKVNIITRSGLNIHHNAEIVIPIHQRLLAYLTRSSDFTQLN